MISYCPKPFEDKKQVQFCHVLSPHSIISHYRTMKEQKNKKQKTKLCDTTHKNKSTFNLKKNSIISKRQKK
jgi:hypothetical protein